MNNNNLGTFAELENGCTKYLNKNKFFQGCRDVLFGEYNNGRNNGKINKISTLTFF